MKGPTCFVIAACFLALNSCREPERTEDMAAGAMKWEPGIYSATRQDDGVVLGVVLPAEKKMQFFVGERLLAAFWTCADAPTDVFIAVRDGGLILGGGITTTADPLGLGEVVFSDGFPNLRAGVNDIVLGTVDGQVPFGVRLIPNTENEMRAIMNHEPDGRANPVSTSAPPEQEAVEKSLETLPPKAERSNSWETATGQEILWGGVEMTSPEPRILPVSMKGKIRERMSPREIVATFGKGWMSKQSGVGSISWRFVDQSMIFILFRSTPVDQAVDVHRHEPPKNEAETIKTDDEIKSLK